MKLLFFILFALASCQLNLFDQALTANAMTYTVPNSILNPGFDSFAAPAVPTPPIYQDSVPQPRFMQEGSSMAMGEVVPGFESSLASQAQNMIEQRNIPTPVVENTVKETGTQRKNAEGQEEVSVKNLNVDGKLMVSGGIVIEKNGLRLSNETNFLMGNESVSVGKVLEMVRFATKMKEICGENFENCAPQKKEETKGEDTKNSQQTEKLEKAKYRLKQKNSRFLELNIKKKGKKQNDLSAEELAKNSIDLDARAKEHEVEAAVEKVMSDEDNLSNYGTSNNENA